MIVIEHAPEPFGDFDRIIQLERKVEDGLFDYYVRVFEGSFNSAVELGKIDDLWMDSTSVARDDKVTGTDMEAHKSDTDRLQS